MTFLPAAASSTFATVPPGRADWAAPFLRFAEQDCPEDPLYQALCRALAAQPALLTLMDEAPPEQARPNLYLAAVHALVMAAPQSALAGYFPSVGGQRLPDEALAGALAGFVAVHETALRALLRQRATQTNEIGRCALLWPALQHLARAGGRQRLALFDFGCSAGLNLGVDAYRYRFLGEDGRAVEAGALEDLASPQISCRWQGMLPAAQAGFELVRRQGVDLSPLHAAEPDDARWLLACLWPHDRERRERLQSALAVARARDWPVQGAADGLALLEAWLDDLPPDVQPVLFHSWVLYYFQAADRHRFGQRVQRLMEERGLWWLSAESLADSDWPADAALPPRPEGVSAGSATLWQWRRAGQAPQALAWSHPHGRFAHWLASGGASKDAA
ncbi:DUF2332 domain-containing protein [Mitsuaria sp. WAJ17]|uniref:DUF2332 domain-containing protein n=1 Tax=Mitsuaria sp. WAJ17 TaxID=2761452 RepID=UPI0016046D51|nr:DUF2332 domain-containing protein [Mitsuaria sp. WAJ17]MBB2483886.1 DUF2332 domain-containing protein [Mitsuaria sp. WAJ17]